MLTTARRARGRLAAGGLAIALVVGAAATGVAHGQAPTLTSTTPAMPSLIGVWSAEERAAIARAWRKLPDEIGAGAPREVARDAAHCDPSGWPSDDALADDRGRIHLCASVPSPSSPSHSGAAADAVARQVALGWIYGFDRAAGWSDDAAWRRLNRWRWSLGAGFAPRADNLDPAGFAEPRGQRSPRWDLVTFLGALLLDAPAPGVSGDGGIACRLISQTIFVRARLQAPGAASRCAPFEAWADLDRLAGVEVVLAAPSTAMIGSLFGHLFLRLVYSDDGATPAHLSRTVAFLADNDVPFSEDPTYALKGIVGSYSASLHERPFLEAYRDYVVIEGRDLRRWRLDLSAGERRALMERIWTVAHGTKVAYYFFRRNCATLMVDLVDDILSPGRSPSAPPPGLLATPPATTLEPWASARAADGAPLLQFVPEPIASFDNRARLAAQHRRALEPGLAGALPPEGAAAATAAFHEVHAAAAPARAAGYDQLARLLARARDGRTGARDGRTGALRAWLADSATIEAHLSTLANLEAEARDDRARRDQLRSTIDALAARLASEARAMRFAPLDQALGQLAAFNPDTRLDGYRGLLALTRAPGIDPALAGRLRLLALLQSELRYDVTRMKGVPGLRDALLFVDAEQPIERQSYVAGHEALLRLPCETHVSAPLLALQHAKQALFAARVIDGGVDRLPVTGPSAAAGPEAAVASETSARRDYDGSLPHSGIDRFALLGGVGVGAGAPRAGLVLAGALYDEQLGDHHRFGFPSDTALVVGRSALFVVIARGAPALAAYDAELFGYRSLRTPLPEAGGGRWPLGWELFGTVEGDRARALAAAPKVGWGVLAPLAERGQLTDHLLGGLALAYAADFPTAGAKAGTTLGRTAQALSAPLSLELRAGVGAAPRYRSAVAAKLWVEPMATLAAGGARFDSEAGARIEAHLALGSGARIGGTAHDPALLLRAQLLRTTLTFTGAGAATEAMFSAGVDLR